MTASPTLQPTATATATPAPQRSLVPDATPTAQPSLTYLAAYTSISPDRLWVARGVALPPEKDDTYRTQLRVWRTDGSVEWTVVDTSSNWGLGWTTPRPLRWSHDGRSLYWTAYGVPDGCAGFGNGWGLYEVDLASGGSVEVLPPEATWMELSPQEDQLAYVPRAEHAVIVRDLQTGQESTFALQAGRDDPSASIGHLLWSPDRSALILTVALGRCQALDRLAHTILYLDLATGAERVLVDRDDGQLVTRSWADPGVVLLQDPQGGQWRLDVSRGKVVRAEDLDLELPASCRADGRSTSLYVNPEDGYCLLYPAGFVLRIVRPGWVLLEEPELGQGEPPRARLSIWVEQLTGDYTLAQIVDQVVNVYPEVTVTRTAALLGGEPAVVVHGIPVHGTSRQAFAIREGRAYRAILEPMTVDWTAPDVETAWQTLIQSFAFIPDPSQDKE